MIFEIGQDAKTKASYINYAITNEMEQRMKENNYMKTREIFNGNDSIYTNLQEQNRNLRKFNESQSKITRK